jgi:MoxR-like ATPase
MSESSSLLKPAELEPATEITRRICEQMDRCLLGRESLHRLVVIGLLSRGHILLEGLPGLGKTALVRTIGSILQLDFNRVQFTPDLMPGDVLGTHILQQTDSGQREMIFEQGPVFTNILLADEINRASPKTQSAMLETMQERSVTLRGQTRELPDPFFVIASQNPIEMEGTYPLPEAQLDRFLFRVLFDSVDAEVLQRIITERRQGELPSPTWQASKDDLTFLFSIMERIFLPKPVAGYIARLVSATHPDHAEASESVKKYVQYGTSPRAAIAMGEAARAHALIDGRPTVGFEDVAAVAKPVMNHRLILNYQARFDRMDTGQVLADLLDELDETGLDLPADVSLQNA